MIKPETTTTIQIESMSEDMPENSDTVTDKREPCSLDDHYQRLYLDEPWKTHLELYEMACELAGIKPVTYAKQAAYDLHKRLKAKLHDLLRDQSDSDQALGRATMRKLCKDAESESVKGQMATALSKPLFPDHIVTKDMTLEEAELELDRLEKEEEALRKPH